MSTIHEVAVVAEQQQQHQDVTQPPASRTVGSLVYLESIEANSVTLRLSFSSLLGTLLGVEQQ